MTAVLSSKEKTSFRLALIGLLVGIVWLGVAIVGLYRVPVPAVGGSYVEAVVGAPQFVNPIYASVNDVDTDLVSLIYSGLMRYDHKQRLVTDLAVDYQVSEDEKVYTFNLKKDVVWHDGEPFTAEDVAFTIDTIKNKQVNSPLKSAFQGATVDVVNDYTVRFRLEEPFGPFLSQLTVGMLPKHVWAGVSPERLHLAQQNIKPIGTGPFAFRKLTKNELGDILYYEMERFEDYYRKTPYIETFAFQFYNAYDGPVSPIRDLREQTVDGLQFVPSDLKKKANRKHINLYTLQLPQYTALFFNQERKEILQDDTVRQALALAIDKDRIVRESLDDEADVINGPLLPGSPGYGQVTSSIGYDPQEAAELLDDVSERVPYETYRAELRENMFAEWRERQVAQTTTTTTSTSQDTGEESGDEAETGDEPQVPDEVAQTIDQQLDAQLDEAQTYFRTIDDDTILSLELTTADTPEQRHAAELVAGFWQGVGVQTNITIVDPKYMTRDVLDGRQYDALLYGVIIGGEPDQYAFWHSSQTTYPGLNLAQYENDDVDALLEQARGLSDPDGIAARYAQFEQHLVEDIPAIFLYTPTYTYALSEKVKGFNVHRISHPSDRFANVIQWYIKTTGEWK